MTTVDLGSLGHPDAVPVSPCSVLPCDVAIFMALAEEAAEARRRIRPHLQGGDGRLHGDWRGRRVRLQVTGPGLLHAEREARRMLESVKPRLVICAGLAGGLRPDLRRGDLVVADRVIDEHAASPLACDAHAVEAATLLGAARATLVGLPRVVCTVDEKRTLAARAAMVDMESLAVARVAAEHGVPFVAVRVISDAAHEGFPLDLNRYIDAQGDIRRTALALAALARPRGIPFLLGMRSTAVRASVELASFIERMLDTVPLVS